MMPVDELSALYLRAERECGFGTDTIRTHWDGCACRQLARVEAEREVERLRAREATLLAKYEQAMEVMRCLVAFVPRTASQPELEVIQAQARAALGDASGDASEKSPMASPEPPKPPMDEAKPPMAPTPEVTNVINHRFTRVKTQIQPLDGQQPPQEVVLLLDKTMLARIVVDEVTRQIRMG